MNSFFQNILLLSSIEEPPPNEAERLLAEIEAAKEKIKCAWNHLDFAAPEYVEIAVLELLVSETQYSLLNRRYRLLKGFTKETTFSKKSADKRSAFSLEENLQSHAFYGPFSPLRKISSQDPFN